MRIEKNEVAVKFTLREAQSLLMVLRRVNATQGRAVDMHGIPIGVKDDMRDLQSELERALLMDEKVGA